MCASTIALAAAFVILLAAFLIQAQILRRMLKTCEAQGAMCRKLIGELKDLSTTLEQDSEKGK